MTTSRDDQARSLLVDAAALVATAEVTGWSPQAAEDALDTIDLLVESLGRLGAPVTTVLAPVGPAMDAFRVLIAASRPPAPAARTAEDGGCESAGTTDAGRTAPQEGEDGAVPAPACSRPAVLSYKRPGEEWLSRDPLRAEREYLDAHRAFLEPSETDSRFSALPGHAKIAALRRIRAGEDRRAVVADLHRRHDAGDRVHR
ncbi:hypothetical protein ACFY5K_36340 [Streptomyces griseofuscus]|uniref:hypothetical protein n=1 Tax=Streptomyces griseofuscus TaxID=146922 RepID=UPI0036879BD5